MSAPQRRERFLINIEKHGAFAQSLVGLTSKLRTSAFVQSPSMSRAPAFLALIHMRCRKMGKDVVEIAHGVECPRPGRESEKSHSIHLSIAIHVWHLSAPAPLHGDNPLSKSSYISRSLAFFWRLASSSA